MSKKNSYQKEMKAYAKNSSSRHLDILRQSELSTFEINEHNMQVEAYPNTFSALSGEIVALEKIKRGEIYYADLSPVVGSEQGGVRPVLIIQNDIGNKYSPTVIVSAITSQLGKAKLPTHIDLSAEKYNLPKNSVALLEQIRTLDKRRLREKVTSLGEEKMREVNRAILISLGF